MRIVLPKFGTYVDLPDGTAPDQVKSIIDTQVVPGLRSQIHYAARERLWNQQRGLDIPQGVTLPPPTVAPNPTSSSPATPTAPTAPNTVEQAAAQATAIRPMTTPERAENAVRDVVGDNTVDQLKSFGSAAVGGAKTALRYAAATALGGEPGAGAMLAHDEAPRVAAAARRTGTALAEGDIGGVVHGAVQMLPVIGTAQQQLEQRGQVGDVGGLLGDVAGAVALPVAVKGGLRAADSVRQTIGTKLADSATARQAAVIDPGNVNPEGAQSVASDQLAAGTARMSNPPVDLAQRTSTAEQAFAQDTAKPTAGTEDIGGIGSGVGRIAGKVATEGLKTTGATILSPHLGTYYGLMHGVPSIFRLAKDVMSSPGWVTAGNQIRYDFGKAISGKDFARAAEIGASISPETFADPAQTPEGLGTATPPRAVSPTYDPTVTQGSTATETVSPSTLAELSTREPPTPEAPATPVPPESITESAGTDTQAPSPVGGLNAPDTVRAAMQQAADIRQGDTGAAYTDVNPIPPRNITRKTAQLEINGEPVGKRVPYTAQLPEPTPTIESARALTEQRLARQQARQQATLAIARDTMKSESYPQWALEDQKDFGKAVNAGDPGAAAAISSRAAQQTAGVDDPAFGAIHRLPVSSVIETYRGNGIYIDPDGKFTQIDPQADIAVDSDSNDR